MQRTKVNVATRAAAVLLLVLLAACGSASNGSQNSAAVAVYPAGIEPFRNPTLADKAGLYTSFSIHNCCFIQQRARLTLDKPVGARTATLQFFVPDVAPFRKGGQSVTVSVEGAKATGSGAAGKWIAVSLALPPRFIGRTAVPVEISAAKSFNPAKLGMNGDTRDLSVILQKVDYR